MVELIVTYLGKSVALLLLTFIGICVLYVVLRITFLAIFKSWFDAKKQHKEGKNEL